MDHSSNDRKSVLMFITAVLIFGTVGIFRRFIPFSSAFLAFSRGILGGLFLLLYMKLKGKTCARLPWPVLGRLALTGAVMGLNWILLFEAYNYTTVGIATLCYYMQPTIVILLSPLLFNERLTLRKILCALVALAGMVLVSGVLDQPPDVRAANLPGILLGLGAALFYAFVVIMNKKTSGIDAYPRTTVQLLSAGLAMVPYLLFTKQSGSAPVSVAAIVLLLIVGLVHTGLAYILYFGSMKGLKAQSIALLSYIDPVAALLFSALFLGETLSGSGMLGAIFIIGSAIIAEL